jgi:hypothetical protein
MWARYYRQKPMGASMTLGPGIRRIHRVLAIAFTMTVVANFAVRAVASSPDWLTYSPLPPLFLLMFTGLYMFSLPYIARRRAS